MPAKSPDSTVEVADKLCSLGKQIRAQRKALRISATVTAEAAGMSRVTLHRIENGEPSVTIGAYLNAMAALDLDFGIIKPSEATIEKPEVDREGWIPARIQLADYPQLRQLAWQLQGIDALTPAEALSIYERNWRHMDLQALDNRERQLVNALRLGFSERHSDV